MGCAKIQLRFGMLDEAKQTFMRVYDLLKDKEEYQLGGIHYLDTLKLIAQAFPPCLLCRGEYKEAITLLEKYLQQVHTTPVLMDRDNYLYLLHYYLMESYQLSGN